MKTILCDPELRSSRSPGRPRSQASRASILETTYRFLLTLPVAEISTLKIAREAGVSTATVYRWWSNKEELLLEAFLHKADHAMVLKSNGPPLLRLKEHILQVGRFFTGDNGVVVARLLGAIQDNAELRKQFIERVTMPRSKETRAMVSLAVESGDLPANLQIGVFLDLIMGPLLARLLLRHGQIDEEFVSAVFDQVVAGAKVQRGAAYSATKSTTVTGL